MHNDQLKELLIDQVRDIYDAEKQLVKALPKLAKASQSEELGDAIRQHWDDTQRQVERLETIFEFLEVPAKGKTCKGMKGLIAEGSEAAEEAEGVLRDLAIIAASQRVEHYEIATYGGLTQLAKTIGRDDIAEILGQTLGEEKEADELLTSIAESNINEEASQEAEADE